MVIPALERFFLRHHQGFALVRELVHELWQQPGEYRCLVVCDSWAWAMLSHIAPTKLLMAEPLTLAPFRAELLERWIAETIQANFTYPLALRRTDTGKKAVRLSDEGDSELSSDFLTYLSAYVRGNPAVAAHTWRRSLFIAADEQGTEIDETAQTEAAGDRGQTVWVTAWDKVALPSLPGNVDVATLLTLHALLVHNGLDMATLSQVLATSITDLARQLPNIAQAGLIWHSDGRWRVTPIGYPAIRARLSQEGFLTDAL